MSMFSVTASTLTNSIFTNNAVGGVVVTLSSGSLINNNTINGNGDGLVSTVACHLSAGNFGNNVPLLCL